ncbi:hypothetical protein Pla100_02160 [Neorhodopirellula pilleata]|uniref:Uncharacterized protein n=2 Tax=Neorhodopirellula pilleata TaxID=2714738 RepID=A0A5C6AUN3_9BACT|nr:hypothetical protein Pla100_02160 [Neorhodopirellula pilleata]
MPSSRMSPSVVQRRLRLLASIGLGIAFSAGGSVVERSRLAAADAHWNGACPPTIPQHCPPSDCNPHVYPHGPMSPSAPVPPSWYHDSIPLSPGMSAPMGQPSQPFDPPVTDDPSETPSDEVPPAQSENDPPAAAPDDTPATNNFDNINASDFQSSFASTQSSFSAAPTVIGDFAGGGFAQFNTTIRVISSGYAAGFGSPNPTFDLIAPGGSNFPDLISVGPGFDVAGNDSFIDTYDLAEPLPPTDAPLAPGPGFTYDGGTIVYTNGSTGTDAVAGDPLDGDLWYYNYVYTRSLGGIGGGGDGELRPVPSPGVSVRRVKISENYSPEIRDRAFFNYSFFNDFVGGLGDISRFVVGMERVVVEDLFSMEVRLPVAATYGSRQSLNDAEARDMEVGNVAFIGKASLFRGNDFMWVGGLGVSIPTADDTEITMDGFDLVNIENKTVQIQPFTSVLKRWGDWTAQAYMQLDLAANGDPVHVNNNLNDPGLGTLEQVGVFTDSNLMHLDFSLHCLLYQRAQSDNGLNAVISNAELHYTTTLQDADLITQNTFDYTALQNNFDIVNTTLGAHFVFGKKNDFIVTPAMAIPLRDGFDKQFDYEALVQVNYLH